jgi:hypothetical protein
MVLGEISIKAESVFQLKNSCSENIIMAAIAGIAAFNLFEQARLVTTQISFKKEIIAEL